MLVSSPSFLYRLVTGSFDKVIKIWSQDGKLTHRLDGFVTTITDICYSPKNKTLWVASGLPTATLYDPKSGENVIIFVICFILVTLVHLLGCPLQKNELAASLPQACHKLATSLPQACHKLAATLPQPCRNLATSLPQPCHKLATSLPQPCHKLAATLPQACHKLATSLPQPCHKLAVVLICLPQAYICLLYNLFCLSCLFNPNHPRSSKILCWKLVLSHLQMGQNYYLARSTGRKC